ncbi:ATP-grasp domain-containing protein [Vibrio spartinae]|uniref:Carbamoyl phosphate synthase-like protein n=1 Tax=Vibrio spartinae TaxID=1918945 RepID=A0A1N6M2L2_9VIBR|nr:ATP-grasp domain-containing protein [Vibrio spartinae]QMV13039.1 carbamoyl phosphate synthase-like protein [Vibrio spartinae]SIO93655.1 carbamoyl phosphate synthase-like protein [Vibrio spartinae]
MKHVLIINRYDDIFSNYNLYINSDEFYMSFITLKGKEKHINPKYCLNVKKLDELKSKDVLDAAIEINERDHVDLVIAHSEYDLDSAAMIRDALGISGAKIEDNELHRNKVLMKSTLMKSNVPFPMFKKLQSKDDIYKFISEYKYPCIIKPEVGAASEGVYKIFSHDDIPSMESVEGLQIEQFIDGDIYHVDAIISCDDMPYFKVSKYINTCLDFRYKVPLGSFTIDDLSVNERLKKLAFNVADLLRINNQAMHLEIIEHDDEFYFLEIGARVGGGEIPFVAYNNEGVDLFELWTKVSLGKNVDTVKTKVTGFLMVPNPFESGYQFADGFQLEHPNITYQKLNLNGENIGFSYDDIPAIVHFEGENSIEVRDAIVQCMSLVSSAIIPLTYEVGSHG